MADTESQIQHFDLDEWVESVEGETITLFDPDDLGWRPAGFIPREHLCGNCEEMVMLIANEHEVPTDCPLCGRQIGMLERGTGSVEEWREYPEEEKNV